MSVEMDKDVAQEVMKWRIMDATRQEREIASMSLESRQHIIVLGFINKLYRDLSSDGRTIHRFWSPSTDFTAAFEVVAEMRRRGRLLKMYEYRDSVIVHFVAMDDEYDVLGAEGTTFTEAICKAAIEVARTKE